MKIEHTFKGKFTNEVKTIVEDDMCSPSNGYTQAYAERSGKDYETVRAAEQFGDHDEWEWQESKYIK